MKKYICLYFLLLSSYFLNAQSRCEKGTWVIGFSPVSYSLFSTINGKTYLNDTLYSTTKNTTKNTVNIGFGLSGGYFVKDNFCIGAGWNTLNSAPYLPTTLFARYYLMQKKRCFSFTHQDNTTRSSFFLQGTIVGSYNSSNSDNTITSNNNSSSSSNSKGRGYSYSYGAAVAIGYTYMVSKHIAFELMTTYSNINSCTIGNWGTSQIGTGAPTSMPSSKIVGISSHLNMSFGIQTYF